MRGLWMGLLACLTAVVAMLWMPGTPNPPQHTTFKRVLLTGGTSGLGRASVELLAKRGDEVFTCGRNLAQVRELDAMHGVHAAQVDLTSPEAISNWATQVKSVLNGKSLDVIVNNAGILKVGVPASSYDAKTFDLVMNTNVRAPALVTSAFWDVLTRPNGKVINIGSTTETSKLAQAFHSIYTMSKVALKAYSTGLRQEGKLSGVHVVHVKAGAFDSNLHHSFDTAAEMMKASGGEFVRYAAQVQKGMAEKLKMVTPLPSSAFANYLHDILHAGDDGSNPKDEYWLNVSWLELLPYMLPQWLMDRIIVGEYS